jgi:hypothetical protein
MHSIKNILERNKIDTQSRADTYIRRTRLFSKSEYNLKSGCTLKTLSSGQKNPKNPKKPKKTQKTPKTKKTHWAGFKKKKTGFFQP